MTSTWALIAFIGFMPPLQIRGYQSHDACIAAGEYIANLCAKSNRCNGTYYCVPGPKRGCGHEPTP